MTPDEVIAKAWEITGNDECDGVTWTAASDQWWRVTASCLHGKYTGTSAGPMDVSTAFARVLERLAAAHDGSDKE
jgi:hypothetical protein